MTPSGEDARTGIGRDIVVIGASAGRIEALREIAERLHVLLTSESGPTAQGEPT